MRDYLLAVEPAKALPRTVSLRSKMPAVYDQGQLGSCTANSIGAILEFNELKQAEADAATPSRLFIYYNERAMEGTISQDSGAEIRDGIKSVAQLGAPPETSWPYVITKFARKPPVRAYKTAMKHQAIRYARVAQTEMGIQNVLAAGYPISFGFKSTSRSRATSARTGSSRCRSPVRAHSAATPSSRSATSRSGASCTSNAATPGGRTGQITATSGYRRSTPRAGTLHRTSG